MKKQILLLLVTVISATGWAQNIATFGIRAGLSSANVRGDAADNLDNVLSFTNGMVTTHNRTGLFAGAYATISLGTGLSFEPALQYAQKGYELRGELGIKGTEFLGAKANARLQSDYIDMPLLLKADLGSGFQVFAGPQFSYLVSSKLKTNAGVLGFNLLNNTMDVKDQFNQWDMGVTGGVAYQFKNGVNVMASYDYGLSRIDANQNINGYNNAIKVGLGFRF